MNKTQYDIIIVGGGVVGFTLASLLAQSTTLRIAIIDQQRATLAWSAHDHDLRVFAITHATQRIFESLNIWSQMCDLRVSPYRDMEVWDGINNGTIQFNYAELGVPQLGHIIENQVLHQVLLEHIEQLPTVKYLSPVSPLAITFENNQVSLRLDNQRELTASLLVGADGANSWVREHAEINLQTWAYNHTAIVATVQHQQAHQRCARQVFTPTGPLAFLPLKDEFMSSIVWSIIPEQAEKLLAESDEQFKISLTNAFDHRLGMIETVSRRLSFPLHMRHAKHYVKDRIALVGDAAHTLHPLAGQGINLGLLDAACLAEVIQTAFNKQRDVGSLATLRRYERWRKAHNLGMIAAMESFKHLFMAQALPITWARSTGLNIVNRLSLLKSFFAKHAMGIYGDLPEVCKLRSQAVDSI